MPHHEYVVRIDRCRADALLELRGIEDLRVFPDADVIWIHTRSTEQGLPGYLAALPGNAFQLGQDNTLTPPGNHLATSRLSNPQWLSLQEWLKVRLTATNWPGRPENRIRLELVDSASITPSSAVLTSIEFLAAWIDESAAFRFQNLTFAMNTESRVLVVGSPLPSLRGIRFQLHDRIAIPAGRHWSPAIDTASVRRIFGDPDGTILWSETDTWEIIPATAFAAVTRAAVRASHNAMNR